MSEGYSAHTYTPLRTSPSPQKGVLVFTVEREIKAMQFRACTTATALPFSQASRSRVCILMGFVCFLPEEKADAKKSEGVSARASAAVDCRIQHRGWTL